MKKIINYIETNIWIIYLFLFLFMIFKHMSVQLDTGDDMWFYTQSKMGILDFTKMRIETWTSRNIIEIFMLVMLNLNKWVWIIIDSAMFVLILHSIRKIVYVRRNNSLYLTILIVILLLLFPFEILKQAGWYATTMNYIWPLAFGLYGLSFITRILTKEKIRVIQKIIVLITTIYAINQEQMCALFIGFYGIFIIYCLIQKISIPLFVYIILALSLSMFAYHILCPGNANRKIVETTQYYPSFIEFSIIDKLFLGIITTISIGFINPVYFIYFWNAAVLYLLVKHKGQIYDIITVTVFTVINLFISVSDKFNSHIVFKQCFSLFEKYLANIKYIDFQQISMYLVIIYFGIFVMVNLYLVYKYFGKKIFLIIAILFMASFCARIILGFSASIFVSGMRTFINSYFLIIIAGLVCVNHSKIEKII